MRRRLLATGTAALLLLAGGAVADQSLPSVPVPLMAPGAGSFLSANVTHVGTVPLEGVGVSMRVQRVGERVQAYVSGAAGLSVYDATEPEAPLLMGHLPLYNWENEDVAVSRDGATTIVTEFQEVLYLHVVDTSDPSLPRLRGSLLAEGAHTVACADDRCDYLFGSNGVTYDLRDRDAPTALPRAQWWTTLTGAGAGHALHRDAAGVWVADSNPLVVFVNDPDPLHLRTLTTGTVTKRTAYQHNNIRPRASRYRPRAAGEGLGGPLRDGELLLGNGETNFTGTCEEGSGAFSTWSMAGFDRGEPMRQLDVLRPVSGRFTGGDPAVNAMGCSGHWFTARDGSEGSVLVAAAWYEHGTRFLSVDPRTGRIRQVGFFQPVRGAASQAYWIPGTDVVWTLDYHSGIDVLRFDGGAAEPTTAQLDASWSLRPGEDPLAAAMRRLCRTEGRGELAHEEHARARRLLASA